MTEEIKKEQEIKAPEEEKEETTEEPEEKKEPEAGEKKFDVNKFEKSLREKILKELKEDKTNRVVELKALREQAPTTPEVEKIQLEPTVSNFYKAQMGGLNK